MVNWQGENDSTMNQKDALKGGKIHEGKIFNIYFGLCISLGLDD